MTAMSPRRIQLEPVPLSPPEPPKPEPQTEPPLRPTPLVEAALALDPHALQYHVEMSPEEALAFESRLEGYNEFSANLVAELVKHVNAIIPRMDFGGDNGNNGHTHHAWRVGREHSRVLYLQFRKSHMPKDFDYKKLTKKLEIMGKMARADESDCTVNDESEYKYRWWWD